MMDYQGFSGLMGFLVALVDELKTQNFIQFRVVFVAALLLAAGMWVFCSFFSRLWNRHYHLTAWHHVLCFFAAAATFFVVLLYPSLEYLKPFAYASVQSWQSELNRNNGLWNEVIRKCRKACESMGIKQGSDPLIISTGTTTPSGKTISGIKKVSQIHAQAIVENFIRERPGLSLILSARGRNAQEAINKEMEDYFEKNPMSTMNQGIIINEGGNVIRRDLDQQIPKIVPYARTGLILVFLFFQGIPFGIIAIASYRDIKVYT
jgi:hypothetical protein